jgi:hypothetical protein
MAQQFCQPRRPRSVGLTTLEKFLGRYLKRVDDHNSTDVLSGLQIFA